MDNNNNEYEYEYEYEYKNKKIQSKINLNNKFLIDNKKKLFFDLTINEILNKWSLTMLDIINDIIEILSLKKYDQYFNNIENGNEIYLGIYEIIKDIFKTLTIDDRGY